jgi:hypothetical protein
MLWLSPIKDSHKFVTKLLRADGGCLGVGRRRKALKTAISLGESSNRL